MNRSTLLDQFGSHFHVEDLRSEDVYMALATINQSVHRTSIMYISKGIKSTYCTPLTL